MNTAQLIDALAASLATAYPTRVAELSARTGQATCVVALDGVAYDTAAMCDPAPTTVTATVTVIAAGTGEQGVRDLLTRTDSVAALIRAAGFTVEQCDAADANDAPALVFTATAEGEG